MSNPTKLFADALKAGLESSQQMPSTQQIPSGLALGENGCPEYTLDGLGDSRLAIFSKFVRGIPTESIDELVIRAISQIDGIEQKEHAKAFVRDLFVLAFEKRDCRGGEGERTIFYHFFWRLVVEYDWIITREMISLIPDYGSWNDLFNIIDYLREYNKSFMKSKSDSDSNSDVVSSLDSDSDSDAGYPNVTGRIGQRGKQVAKKFEAQAKTKPIREQTLFVHQDLLDMVIDLAIDIIHDQWVKDIGKLDEESNGSVSLLAKWLPTERGHFAKKNYKVFKKLLDKFGIREKEYRGKLTALRAKIDVAETHMCNGTWAQIDPKKTPSVCAFKWRKSFLNLPSNQMMEMCGTLRYPENEDRMAARERWLAAVKSGKVKGAQLSPDMMVQAVQYTYITKDEVDLIDAQWVSLRDSVRSKIAQARADGYEPMDNIIPMCDMSPSMSGTPMLAAVGLGIMLSELNSGACGNLIITFDSDCHVVDLSGCATFSEKVKKIYSLPIGYSTNFHLAMERICGLIRAHKLPQESIPALCILSDEQFDHHQFGYSRTMEDQMTKMFAQVGLEVSGTAYSKPRTVHWNLRGDTDGYPAQADSRNVQMIAGYSPALFDLILCGFPEPTPYQTMRRKLDSPRYQPVRDAFDASEY